MFVYNINMKLDVHRDSPVIISCKYEQNVSLINCYYVMKSDVLMLCLCCYVFLIHFINVLPCSMA